MNRASIFQLITAAIFVLTPQSPGQTSVSEARTGLEKWIEARQLTSKTQTDWQAEKEFIGQSTDLYRRELTVIADQMTKVSTNNTQTKIEREMALIEQSELTAALDRVKTLVGGLEQKTLALAPTFPPPLTDKLQPLLKRIPADSANTKASGLERLQNIVALLNEVDKFNSAVTVVSEVQKNTEGAEVQVETMYFGLAQAYFVDKSGGYAGVGVPAAAGWQWTPALPLAGKIQQTIAMYKNAAPAAFVGLPVQLQ